MDFDVVSLEMFNALPETPAVVEARYETGSSDFIALPLHRHGLLKPNNYVVWELHSDRMVAKQKEVTDVKGLFPVFWLKDQNGASVAYEFIEQKTVDDLGADKSRLLHGAFSALEHLESPGQFGVSSLWPAYRDYLGNNGKLNADYLSDRSETVMAHLNVRVDTSDEPSQKRYPSFFEGMKVPGSDCEVCFTEIDVDDDVHLLPVEKKFLEGLTDEVDTHILHYGGVWSHRGGLR